MRGKCALFATISIWQIEIIIPILRKERTFLYKSQSRVSSHANPFADKFDSSCLFLANRLIDLDFIPIHLVDIIFQWRAFRNVQFTQFHRGNNYTWIVLRRCFLFNLNLIAPGEAAACFPSSTLLRRFWPLWLSTQVENWNFNLETNSSRFVQSIAI